MSRPAVARIHLGHLRHNYRLIKKRAGKAEIMCVVKANAYGHGLHLVAPALLDEGCRSFAVTDAGEGAKLRQLIGKGCGITLLSGIFDASDAALTREFALTPVITESTQVEYLAAAGYQGTCWLKVDTGMNRLGAEDVAVLAEKCSRQSINIIGVMSHLACADEPEHPLNAVQKERFLTMAQTLPTGIRQSLLNSAGLIALPDCTFDVVRPGIALYGAEPVRNQPLGLQPVMQLAGKIMQVRDIQRGESLSYGATFTASENMRIATAALGYADGLPRSLSNRGQAAVCSPADNGNTAILNIVGRVCMDYCLLDVSRADIVTGTELEFWGIHIPATQVANQIDTIAYELFTGVAGRIPREAIE